MNPENSTLLVVYEASTSDMRAIASVGCTLVQLALLVNSVSSFASYLISDAYCESIFLEKGSWLLSLPPTPGRFTFSKKLTQPLPIFLLTPTAASSLFFFAYV